MRVATALIGVIALTLTACGDGGVSAEEHAQVLAELTLAQQEAAAWRVAAGEQAASEAEARFAEWEGVIDAAIAEIGLLPDPGRDRVEQLAALVVGLHQDEAVRQAELDAAVEELDAELRRLQEEAADCVTATTLVPAGRAS